MKQPSVLRLLAVELPMFLMPVALFLALPAVLLAAAGEWTGPDLAARKQQAHGAMSAPVIYGPAYTNPARRFKLEAARRANADILILGSSRVTQVRAALFGKAKAFNAAVGGMRIPDPYAFIHSLSKEDLPWIVVVGVDPFFFDVDVFAVRDPFDEHLAYLDRAVRVTLTHWREVYRDLGSGKIDIHKILRPTSVLQLIGVNARMSGNGFRPDGSYRNGDWLDRSASEETPKPADQEHDHRNLIGGRTFDRTVPQKELTQFLEECARRGVDVVGFFPPTRSSVLRQLRDMKETQNYLADAAIFLKKVFMKKGFRFYDFSDAASFGAGDEEAYDDFHFSEKAFARMFLDMARRDERMAELMDMAELERAIRRSSGPLNPLADDKGSLL